MKMKLMSAALSATMLVSGAALALDLDPKFYVGGEVQGNQYKGTSQIKDNNGNVIIDSKNFNNKPLFHKNGMSGSLFLGTKLNEYFGLEAGYTGFAKNKTTNTASNSAPGTKETLTLDVKNQNIYLDAMGYLPVADGVDLIGSVGVGRLTSKVTATDVETVAGVTTTTISKDKTHKNGIRAGVGAQYKFNENMGARLMVRHQKGNQLVKSVNSVGLGLFYQF